MQTGAVADMASHPFKFYLDFGIRVTVNTDNRLITNTTVTKELGILARQFDLDIHDLKNILVAGFKSAFLTFHDRAQLVRKVQQEIGEDIRSSAFAASETLHQLAWVAGGLAGVALSLTSSGVAGMTVAAIGLGASFLFLLSQRRRRILAARHSRPQVVS